MARLEKTNKVAQLLGYISTAQQVYTLGRQAKSWYDSKNIYELTISSGDSIYADMHDWLLSMLPHNKRATLAINSEWDDDGEHRVVRQQYADDAQQYVNFEGHKLRFGVGEPDLAMPKDAGYTLATKNLYIYAFSQEGQQAVIKKIHDIANNMYRDRQKARVYMFSKYGWQVQDSPLRSLDSVVLADGLSERITSDLERFLENEKRYVELGIPWHRGLLFSGPPGSGKTSLAKGLANHLNMNMFYLPVSDLKDDGDLMARVQDIPAKSILLLEDVDTIASMTDREAKGVTMSGMLNTLDGVATPHGLVTIMTTNHVNKIDDAILRAGRVDLNLNIDYPDIEQTERLFKVFYGVEPMSTLDPKGRSTADLTEIFKQHMYDAKAAEKELKELE